MKRCHSVGPPPPTGLPSVHWRSLGPASHGTVHVSRYSLSVGPVRADHSTALIGGRQPVIRPVLDLPAVHGEGTMVISDKQALGDGGVPTSLLIVR